MTLERESDSVLLVLLEPSTKAANSHGRGLSWVIGPHYTGLTSRFLLIGPILQGQDEGLPGGWWSHQNSLKDA